MSEHQELVVEVRRLDAEEQRWASRAVELDSEVAEVDASTGQALLDDPDSAETLGARLTALRDQASMSRRASAKAAENAAAARLLVAGHEAKLLAAETRKARAALEGHVAKATKLQKDLETFTAAEFRPVTMATLVDEAIARTGTSAGVTYRDSNREQLQRMVVSAERRQAAMEAAARGDSPRAVVSDLRWADLGDCLCTGGVLDLGMVDPETAAREERQQKEDALTSSRERADTAQEHLDGLLRKKANDQYAGMSGLDDRIKRAQSEVDQALSMWHTARGVLGLPETADSELSA